MLVLKQKKIIQHNTRFITLRMQAEQDMFYASRKIQNRIYKIE